MPDRPRTYREFWPYYLREHRDGRSRAVHYLGSSWAVVAIFMALATGDWRWLAAALLGGYGMAWLGHIAFERNHPTTFRYPLWSLISDYRMLVLWATGRLGPHLRRSVHD